MSAIYHWIGQGSMHRIGWALLHSLWEGAVIALLLLVALRAMRRHSASARYIMACIVLAMMLAAPLITLILLPPPAMRTAVGGEPPPALWGPIDPPARVIQFPAAAPRPTTPDGAWTIASGVEWLSTCLPWMVTGWVVGVGLLSIWNLGGWLAVQRLRRIGISPPPPPLKDRLEHLRHAMGIGAPVALSQSSLVKVPLAVGWLRPLILLPVAVINGLSVYELEAILCHELAHIRRRDYLVNLMQTLIETLLFYHPAVWWISARIREERENCCDDLVMTDGHTPSVDYASALLAVAKLLSASSDARTPLAPAAMRDATSLRRRISRLLGETRPQSAGVFESNSKWISALMLAAVMSVGVILCMSALTRGANTAKDQNPPLPQTQPPSAATQPSAVTAPPATQRSPDDIRIGALVIEDQTLEDAVAKIRQTTDVNIFVNWRGLEQMGYRKSQHITARFKDVPVGMALENIFNNARPKPAEPPIIGVVYENGVFTVSLKSDFAQNVVTRVYDVRDLVTVAPDYDPSSDSHDPTSEQLILQRDQMTAAIVRLIEETFPRIIWDPSQPKLQWISELEGNLIISAPPAVHEQISQLLDQLHETRAVQVIVEARFLSLDLQRCPPGVREKLEQDFSPGAARAVFLEGQQAQQIIKSTQEMKDRSLTAMPRITLYNGQRAYVLVQTQQAYVSGYIATRKPNSEMKYDVIMATADTGITFDVRATVSSDRKYVTLTLKPKIATLLGLETAPWEGATHDDQAKELTVQKPLMQMQELSTTLSVPDKQTVLLGGFTGSDDTDKSHPMFMLVKPEILIQKR